jgi:hypothetical protein
MLPTVREFVILRSKTGRDARLHFGGNKSRERPDYAVMTPILFSYENRSGSWSLWNSLKDEDGRRLVADRLGSNK